MFLVNQAALLVLAGQYLQVILVMMEAPGDLEDPGDLHYHLHLWPQMSQCFQETQMDLEILQII